MCQLAARSAKYPAGRGAARASDSSSDASSRARSPCMTTSTSARRTSVRRRRAGLQPRRAARPRLGRGVSPSSTAARSDGRPDAVAVRRAARSATRAAAPRETGRAGRARAPSGRAPRRAPGPRRRRAAARAGRRRAGRGTRRAASARRPAASRRSAAPAGSRTAASRGARTARGRPRSGPAVASRSAVTASASSPAASGGSVSPVREAALELEQRRGGRSRGRSPAAAGPAPRASARPARPSTALRTRSPSPRSTCVPTRDADERRDGRVGVALAEERLLELGVRAVERRVVPVEAAARLRGRDEQRQDDRAEQRLVLVGPRPACARAKIRAAGSARRSSSASRASSRFASVRRARLEEGAHERPVLVEGRAAERLVLLEREREILVDEQPEGGEREAAQRAVEVRSAQGHAIRYSAAGPSPLWQRGTPVRHAGGVAERPRADASPQRGHVRLLRR